jgi:hypothetical protein
MNIEQIELFLNKDKTTNKDKAAQEACVKINFKKRDAVYGLFIKSRDYDDLKSKNFWRIVTKTHFDQWHKTKDMNLARIFSGSEFTKLVSYKDAFEE